MMSTPTIRNTSKITLYTNHVCPFAHRVHITLAELGLSYDEVIIPLDRPREEWFLRDVNPRGLVPALIHPSVSHAPIVESAIIAQFLLDAYSPHHPSPSSSPMTTALHRARTAFFIDTFLSKVQGPIFALFADSHPDAAHVAAEHIRTAWTRDIEPLLLAADQENVLHQQDQSGPFFGKSHNLTVAEIMVAPFLIRVFLYAKRGLLPAHVVDDLPPRLATWAKATIEDPSVSKGSWWDEEVSWEGTREKINKTRSEKEGRAGK